jgi:diguanylate cyclase (GGDEF)-like protein/PAS domain S-box-containing protein
MTAGRQQLLRLFIDQAPVAIAMFDRDMRYIATSRRWLADYGLGDRDLRGMSHYEVFPDLPERWREVHRRALAGEVVSASDDRFERADGAVRWLHWEVRPWYGELEPGGIIVFSEDVTERRLAEERFRVVVESSPNANVLVDGEGSIVLVNRRAEELFGYRREEMLGRPVEMLVPEGSRAAHGPRRDAFLADPLGRSMGAGRELFGRCKDGRVVPIEIGLAPIESEAGRLVVASITDITERKDAEARILQLNAELERRVRERTEELERSVASLRGALEEAEALRRELKEQAIRDPLTGLYNRRFLEESLDREVSRAGRARTGVGLLMLDMDGFKLLNDRFGHAAGDAVLREVGRTVREAVLAEDVPCRFGGDEFVVVMPGISLADSMAKAERLRERLALARPQANDACVGGIVVSMGVAAFPDHGTTGEALLESVDAALYRAKALGGGRAVAAARPDAAGERAGSGFSTPFPAST